MLSDAISLRWSFPDHEDDKIFYSGFKVLYRPLNHGIERLLIVEGNEKRSCFLSPLRPDTKYQVTVVPFSVQGNGQVSLPVTMTTLDSGKCETRGRVCLLSVHVYVHIFFLS